jgi:hypothetical protein
VRRLIALLTISVLAASCSSDSGGSPSDTSVHADARVPAAVRSFLRPVQDAGNVAFRGRYHVLRSLGGESDVEVVSKPPAWQLRTGDLIIVGGPKPATCHPSEQRCARGIQEQALVPVGVFSTFFAQAPAKALEADTRRAGAGRVRFSDRTVAGIAMRCAEVPIEGVVASTYCLTANGVFGLVDTTAVHYELTSYTPGDPGEDAGPPFPIS